MNYTGVLPLWKEKGMTSHDAVFKLRKLLKMKRIGHTGTLDPNVEGVLPICLGEATKIVEYIMDSGKEYVAEITLGKSTTTEDADGEIVENSPLQQPIHKEQIINALDSLTGDITQIPPMYSAVKVNGKRLYEYARKGIEVDRPIRHVKIHEMELQQDSLHINKPYPTFTVRISCSKGTYIRTLAVQIGEILGVPAHMSHLVRTKSGGFTQKDCLTLAQVEEKVAEHKFEPFLKSIEEAVSFLPIVQIGEQNQAIQNGQVLPMHDLLKEHDLIAFYENEQIVSIYKKHPEKTDKMKPEKMFVYARKEANE